MPDASRSTVVHGMVAHGVVAPGVVAPGVVVDGVVAHGVVVYEVVVYEVVDGVAVKLPPRMPWGLQSLIMQWLPSTRR